MLLNRDQIAERMSTTPSTAIRILYEHGLKPVDPGRGRGRGLRWYAPAVDTVIRKMHEYAQDTKPSPRRMHAGPHLIVGRPRKELIAELTKK